MSESAKHRDFTRVPLHIRADIRSGKAAVSGKAGDVSVKGLFVACTHSMTVGADCKVALSLVGGVEPIEIDARGTVVRAIPEGVGVEFSEIDPEGYEHLRNLVLYNTPDDDAEAVEEELDSSVGLKRTK
jgi:PilZ domain